MIRTPPIEGMTVGPTRPSRLLSLILFGAYVLLWVCGMGVSSRHPVLKWSVLGAAVGTLMLWQHRTRGQSGQMLLRFYFAVVSMPARLKSYWAGR